MKLPVTLVTFCDEHNLDYVIVKTIYTYLVKKLGMNGQEAISEIKKLYRDKFFSLIFK